METVYICPCGTPIPNAKLTTQPSRQFVPQFRSCGSGWQLPMQSVGSPAVSGQETQTTNTDTHLSNTAALVGQLHRTDKHSVCVEDSVYAMRASTRWQRTFSLHTAKRVLSAILALLSNRVALTYRQSISRSSARSDDSHGTGYVCFTNARAEGGSSWLGGDSSRTRTQTSLQFPGMHDAALTSLDNDDPKLLMQAPPPSFPTALAAECGAVTLTCRNVRNNIKGSRR